MKEFFLQTLYAYDLDPFYNIIEMLLDYGVWTPWSAWSMTTGKKARSRTCDTVECSGEGIEEEACTGTACTGE